jgi:p-aminobenzoyl-glutamate transporter AbgT
MTDKELGKALLTLDTAPPPDALDPKQLARNIIARDGRQLRWLAASTTIFWLITTACIVWLSIIFVMYVEPRLLAYAAGKAQLQADWQDWAKAGDLAARVLLASMITLLLAAVSTVVLILLSRRATLRQINASLMEISQKLTSNH